MTHTYRALEPFWPDQENVNKCIRAKAESDDSLVLLAVHQEMQLLRKPLSAGARKEGGELKPEKELLKAYLEPTEDGFMLLPITGDSGMGKSHMVRWLEAQIKMKEGWDEIYHIVRIPKGVSMREILMRIIRGIPGEKFDKLHTDLLGAVENQSEEQVKQSLRANLLTALHEKNSQLKEERDNTFGGQAPHSLQRRIRLTGEGMLRSYLVDPEVSPVFMGEDGCIAQLARGHMHGSKEQTPKTQFDIDDLKLPDPQVIFNASLKAQNAYDILENENLWESATKLLNELIDRALMPLSAIGSKSMVEVFVDIRKALFDDGKELLLLIEDFAALAGIQETLLDISIRESERLDEQQEMCVMRTAVAMTTDYLTNRDTIRTRAHYEWVVQDNSEQLSGSEKSKTEITIEKVIDMCGRYINASRFGISGLRDLANSAKDLSDGKWIVPFENEENLTIEDRRLIDSFGKTKSGFEIFPLNYSLIERLVNVHLINQSKSELVFNPRDVIKYILRDVLLEQREAFFQGVFPSVSFPKAKLDFSVKEKMPVLSSDNKKQQLEKLVWYWGSSNDNKSKLPVEFFDYLGLPTFYLDDEKSSVNISPKRTKPIINKPSTPTSVETKSKDEIKAKEWLDNINDWLNGSTLNHTPANQVRKWVIEALKKVIDPSQESICDWDIIEAIIINRKLIYLGGADGNGGDDEFRLNLINDDQYSNDDDRKNMVYQFLRARVNYQYLGDNSWDYESGKKDYISYSIILEILYQESKDKINSLLANEISYSVKLLYIMSSVLGLVKNTTPNGVIEGVLGSDISISFSDSETDEIRNLKKICLDSRTKVRDIVARFYSRYQGRKGKDSLVMDCNSLLNELDSNFKDNLSIRDIETKNLSVFIGMANVGSNLSSRSINRAIKSKSFSVNDSYEKYKMLTSGKSKDELCREVKSTVESFVDSGVSIPGISSTRMLELISKYYQLNVSETINMIEPLIGDDEEASLGSRLLAVSKVNMSCIEEAIEILNKLDDFFSRVENKMVEVSLAHESLDNYEKSIKLKLTELNTTIINLNNLFQYHQDHEV